MKKYVPVLLAAVLAGMTVNSAFAAGQGDVDDVTMDVINNSDPHAVTNDIQLPEEANHEAVEHVAGTVDDSDHASDAKSESHDNATEDASDDSKAEAAETTQEDSQDAAQQQADQAMQDATDSAQQQADQAMQDATDAAQQQADQAKQDATDAAQSKGD